MGNRSEQDRYCRFFAGGHLASTAATHFNKAFIDNQSNKACALIFLIVVYPVISMQDSLTHMDSKKNLLGTGPSKQPLIIILNELQVTAQTPPAYITHAGDDKLVTVDNSIVFLSGPAAS